MCARADMLAISDCYLQYQLAAHADGYTMMLPTELEISAYPISAYPSCSRDVGYQCGRIKFGCGTRRRAATDQLAFG
jgi:hypothetical protein